MSLEIGALQIKINNLNEDIIKLSHKIEVLDNKLSQESKNLKDKFESLKEIEKHFLTLDVNKIKEELDIHTKRELEGIRKFIDKENEITQNKNKDLMKKWWEEIASQFEKMEAGNVESQRNDFSQLKDLLVVILKENKIVIKEEHLELLNLMNLNDKQVKNYLRKNVPIKEDEIRRLKKQFPNKNFDNVSEDLQKRKEEQIKIYEKAFKEENN